MAFDKKDFFRLIEMALENFASDIHIRSGEPPCLRINGELLPLKGKEISEDEVMETAATILGKTSRNDQSLSSQKEIDGSFEIPSLCRMRFNFFHYNQKPGIVLRMIRREIPRMEDLELPPVITHIAECRRGLVLVTGPTGCGKSTTLAAMIGHINNTRKCHVVTVEDPVEYLHPQKKARISQREVGRDTKHFHSALRAALRQDPDIILIGEIRDPETVQIALKAAETGHSVFSTLHTTDVITTIGRIISMFPSEEQRDVRQRLAISLQAVVGQRLLERIDGNKGMVAVLEVMLTSPGIQDCISGADSLERIDEIIRESHRGREPKLRGQSFDQHIKELLKKGIIDKKTALTGSASPSDLVQELRYEK